MADSQQQAALGAHSRRGLERPYFQHAVRCETLVAGRGDKENTVPFAAARDARSALTCERRTAPQQRALTATRPNFFIPRCFSSAALLFI